jgi:hypothetical protein
MPVALALVSKAMHRNALPGKGFYVLCLGVFCSMSIFVAVASQSSKPGGRESAIARSAIGADDQRASFSLLRTRPEAIPQALRKIMQRPALDTRWELAQRLPARGFGEFWLIPGKKFICLLARTGSEVSQTCAHTASAVKHGLVSVTLKPKPSHLSGKSSRLLVGVAPGHARRVVVHTAGSLVAVPVGRGGVFGLRDVATNPPDLMTFR